MKSAKLGFIALILTLIALAAPNAASGAGLQDQLNARWRSAHVIAAIPIASNCDGYYDDNDVVGARADSKAGRRFAAGEAARVERVGIHGGRVDVFLLRAGAGGAGIEELQEGEGRGGPSPGRP